MLSYKIFPGVYPRLCYMNSFTIVHPRYKCNYVYVELVLQIHGMPGYTERFAYLVFAVVTCSTPFFLVQTIRTKREGDVSGRVSGEESHKLCFSRSV